MFVSRIWPISISADAMRENRLPGTAMMVCWCRSKFFSSLNMVICPVEGTVRIMILENSTTSRMSNVIRSLVILLMAPVDLRWPLERTCLACRGCVGCEYIRTLVPRLSRSAARANPAGPAPTIHTFSCMSTV